MDFFLACSQNAIRLEEKERSEKERLHQIMDEAESFREEFYSKRKIHCETNKNNNREKEKVIYMYILRKSILFYIFLYLLRCDDEQRRFFFKLSFNFYFGCR